MQTYYINCRKPIDSIGPKKVVMANKVVRQSKKYFICVVEKLKIWKKYCKKSSKKSNLNKITPKVLVY